MSIAITDLLTPLTRDQMRASLVTTLKSLGIPADQWRKGGSFSTILTACAAVLSSFTVLLAQAVGSGFLDTATGLWLVRLAYYVYGVNAGVATFATGNLSLTNTGGGVYTYGAGGATFSNPATGQTYVNTAAFSLGANTTLSIPVQATTAGAVGSAAPNTITTLVTSMLNVTCTNPLSVVGQDAESDAQLRIDCQNKLGALSVRGPRTAYAYYATHDASNNPLLNANGVPVNINRIQVSNASHTGDVTVYLASPSGVPDPLDVTAAAASFEANARPDAVTVTTLPIIGIPYTPNLTVFAFSQPGLTAAAIQSAVQAALVAWIAAYPIGGKIAGAADVVGLQASGINGVVKSAHPAIYAVDGASDLALLAGQVATNGTTVTVRLQ